MKTNPQQKPASKKNRFPVQIILGILVLLAIAAAILITGPTDDTVNPVPPTPTPVPTSFTPSPIAAGQSNSTTYSQTDGVILGAISVMLILFVGTFVAILPSLKLKKK